MRNLLNFHTSFFHLFIGKYGMPMFLFFTVLASSAYSQTQTLDIIYSRQFKGRNDAPIYVSGANFGIQFQINEDNSGSDSFKWGTGNSTQGQSLMELKQDGTLGISGKVGIGTTTPVSALTIKGDGNNGTIRISPLQEGGESAITLFSTTASVGSAWAISHGGWSLPGKFNIGYGPNPFLTMLRTGEVGISTTNPRGKFDVDGPGDIYLTDHTDNGSDQSLYIPGHVYMGVYSDGVSYLQARRKNNSGTSGTTAFQFRTTNNGNLTEAMHITGDGKVGIGTIAPATKLDVAGQIKISGGAPGVGKVLTSDANGLASWTTMTASQWITTGSNNNNITYGGGWVGIGTGSPRSALDVITDKVWFGPTVWNTGKSVTLNLGDDTHSITSAFAAGTTFRDPDSFMWSNNGGEVMRLTTAGSLGIGTNNPQGKLDVAGNVFVYGINGKNATSIKPEALNRYSMFVEEGVLSADYGVAPVTNWADYVFDKNYKLKSLEEVEAYIKQNNHLPDIPSQSEVQENGYSIHDINVRMLEKIEELTLYSIAQQKEIKALKEQLSQYHFLAKELEILKKTMEGKK